MNANDVLSIHIERDGNDLLYRIVNVSDASIWVFVHVPTIENGEYTFAKDAAWLEKEGDVLLVRKVDTPVPDAVRAERIRSGAIQLAPGAERSGAIELGDRVEVAPAYGDPELLDVSKVVMEVGWLPLRDGQSRRDLMWEGQPFAYLRPETEPGEQRLVRSAPIRW